MSCEVEDNDKKIFYDNAITEIADGNTEYLIILYNDIKRDIFIFAYSIVRNYHLAEDVMQDTFIQIQAKADTYSKGTNAKAWILTIAKNLSYKELLKRKNELIVSEFKRDRSYESIEKEIEGIVDLDSALSNLTEEERQIFILHDCTGLKHREIANIMNMKADNIRKIYSRLIKKLYKYIKGCEKNDL